jgi:hypothetical protein
MGVPPMVRVLTHGRWYSIGIRKSEAFFSSNARIAPLMLYRRGTADVRTYRTTAQRHRATFSFVFIRVHSWIICSDGIEA